MKRVNLFEPQDMPRPWENMKPEHEVYPDSVIAAPEGTILTHTTMAHLRPSIMRLGLLARATAEFNYPGMYEQPVGVFGTAGSPWLSWKSGEERDTWEIDASGMPVTRDRILDSYVHEYEGDLRGAWIITQNVPPERLRLLRRGNFKLSQAIGTRWHGRSRPSA